MKSLYDDVISAVNVFNKRDPSTATTIEEVYALQKRPR